MGSIMSGQAYTYFIDVGDLASLSQQSDDAFKQHLIVKENEIRGKSLHHA